MSRRRNFGDVVVLIDEDEGAYRARILKPETGRGFDLCPYECGDCQCREWWTLEVVDAPGEYVYHVPECEMSDVSDQ